MIKDQLEKIHLHIENLNEPDYKGIQLYFSPLIKTEILFIGINPGAGYYNYNNKLVKRLNPLKKFEYVGQTYYLATQTKKIFKSLGIYDLFSKSVKINHFPFATKDEKGLNKLLEKYNTDYKLYYLSKLFVVETIDFVKPKLIICEGKSSFDRLKSILNIEPLEYNENTFILKNEEFVVVGYKRNMSYIKNKEEFISKLNKYYIKTKHEQTGNNR